MKSGQKTQYFQTIFPHRLTLIFCYVIWGLWLPLFLASCSPITKRPLITPLDKLASKITTAEVSHGIGQKAQHIKSFQGLRTVWLTAGEKKYKFSEIVLLETPNKIRIDVLGYLDQPVVMLASDGHTISSYSKTQHISYQGKASSQHMFTFTGMRLSISDMIRVCTGNPPELSPIDYEWGFYLPSIHSYFLEQRALKKDIGQRIWFDVKHGTISHIQEYQLTAGKVTLEYTFGEYETHEKEYLLPHRIEIDNYRDHIHLHSVYSFVNMNHPVDSSLFTLPPLEPSVMYDLDNPKRQQLEMFVLYEEFLRGEKNDE